MNSFRIKPGEKISIDIQGDEAELARSGAGEMATDPRYVGVEAVDEQSYAFPKRKISLHDLSTRRVEDTDVFVSTPFTIDSLPLEGTFRTTFEAQMLAPGFETASMLPADLEKLFVDLTFSKEEEAPYVVLAGHADTRPLITDLPFFSFPPFPPYPENESETDWRGRGLTLKRSGEWSVSIESAFFNNFDTGNTDFYKVTTEADNAGEAVADFSITARDKVKILLTPRYFLIQHSFDDEFPYHLFPYSFALPGYDSPHGLASVFKSSGEGGGYEVALKDSQWSAFVSYVLSINPTAPISQSPPWVVGNNTVVGFAIARSVPVLVAIILKNSETFYIWRIGGDAVEFWAPTVVHHAIG